MKGYYIRPARRIYPHDQYEQTLVFTDMDTKGDGWMDGWMEGVLDVHGGGWII